MDQTIGFQCEATTKAMTAITKKENVKNPCPNAVYALAIRNSFQLFSPQSFFDGIFRGDNFLGVLTLIVCCACVCWIDYWFYQQQQQWKQKQFIVNHWNAFQWSFHAQNKQWQFDLFFFTFAYKMIRSWTGSKSANVPLKTLKLNVWLFYRFELKTLFNKQLKSVKWKRKRVCNQVFLMSPHKRKRRCCLWLMRW